MNGNGYGNLEKEYRSFGCLDLQYYIKVVVMVAWQKNVPSKTNLPPRRFGSSLVIMPNDGQPVLFGGDYNDGNNSFDYNDVWFIDFGLGAGIVRTVKPSATTIPPQTSSVIKTFSLLATVKSSAIETSSKVAFPTETLSKSLVSNSRATTRAVSVDDNHTTPLISGIVLYFAVVVGFLLVISSATLLWICLRRRKKSSLRTFDSTTSMESAYSTTTTTSRTSLSTVMTDTTTMLAGQTEFAVPAFLHYKAGMEFRWNKRIAKGGGGEVYLGDALCAPLSEFGKTIIVKIIGPNR